MLWRRNTASKVVVTRVIFRGEHLFPEFILELFCVQKLNFVSRRYLAASNEIISLLVLNRFLLKTTSRKEMKEKIFTFINFRSAIFISIGCVRWYGCTRENNSVYAIGQSETNFSFLFSSYFFEVWKAID